MGADEREEELEPWRACPVDRWRTAAGAAGAGAAAAEAATAVRSAGAIRRFDNGWFSSDSESDDVADDCASHRSFEPRRTVERECGAVGWAVGRVGWDCRMVGWAVGR